MGVGGADTHEADGMEPDDHVVAAMRQSQIRGQQSCGAASRYQGDDADEEEAA